MDGVGGQVQAQGLLQKTLGFGGLKTELLGSDFNQLMAQLGERANTYLPEALRESDEW